MSTEAPKTVPPAPEPPKPAHGAHPPGGPLKTIALLVVVVLLLFKGIPWIWHALHTVSTDDAYVNSYVTFVAPRVEGQVLTVLVDDNNRVQKGDKLVELDPEPYQVLVAIKQAAVDSAQADLVATHASVRAQVAMTRSQRFKLTHAIEDVDNQVALLRARVATLEQAKASAVLAEQEFNRSKQLLATKVVSSEEFDQKREALDASRALVQQAIENVSQQRVALGLPAAPPEGKPLTDAPADLDQTFSTVRQAVAELLNAASVLGIELSSFDVTPKQVLEEFYKRDPKGDLDKIYDQVIKEAPSLKQAQTKLLSAQRDLDQAKLNLRYCTIFAEIDGVVTRRNVNPGNHVQVGQSLMAVRSLKDIWVDANFKETQLRDLRIGQKVDLELDMYGKKVKFDGRISGFTYGTGSTLSLLPAENATGNFVKVVQRLPVRIDLVDYDPEKQQPLFVGLSVEPTVDLRADPTGPNAGHFLQAPIMPPMAEPAATPAPAATPTPAP